MGVGILLPIFMVLVLVPWLCVAGWVVKDAWEKTDWAPAWGMGVFLMGPPALLLYLSFGEESMSDESAGA